MRYANEIRKTGIALSGIALAVAIPLMPSLAQDEGRFGAFNVRAPLQQPVARPSHPLMTPEAIASARANFGRCLESLWPLAAKRHVTRHTFDAATPTCNPI